MKNTFADYEIYCMACAAAGTRAISFDAWLALFPLDLELA